MVTLMVVRTDIEIAGRGLVVHTFELADDHILGRPAADQLVSLLDRCPIHVQRMIRAVSLEVGIFVPALVVLLDERLVRWPAVAGREGEVVVGVAATDDALGMVLANRMRRNANSNG